MLNDLGAMACRNGVFIHEMARSIIADNDVFSRRNLFALPRHCMGMLRLSTARPEQEHYANSIHALSEV